MSSLGDYMPNSLLEWSPAIGAGVQGVGALAARMFLSPDSWFARHSEVTGVFAAVLWTSKWSFSPLLPFAALILGSIFGFCSGAIIGTYAHEYVALIFVNVVSGLVWYFVNEIVVCLRRDK